MRRSPPATARRSRCGCGCTRARSSSPRAGERAQARSAHEEAIGQLRKATVLVETQPAGVERDARELSLQLALGGSLVRARGFALLETVAAYERAATLGASTDDAVRLGVARTGLAICYFQRGEIERGRALAAGGLAGAGGGGRPGPGPPG